MEASLCGLVLGVFFLGLLITFYTWENKRRDSKQGRVVENSDPLDLVAEQANKTDRQIPSFRYVI